MLKSQVINQSFLPRMLGLVKRWLKVESQAKEYAAKVVATIGNRARACGRDGILFEGEDGRFFYARIVSVEVKEGSIRQLLNPHPIFVDPVRKNLGQDNWIDFAYYSMSQPTKLDDDPALIKSLNKAYDNSFLYPIGEKTQEIVNGISVPNRGEITPFEPAFHVQALTA